MSTLVLLSTAILLSACGSSHHKSAPATTIPPPPGIPVPTTTTAPTTTTTLPPPPSAPVVSPDAVLTITKYVSAREDSIGADQTSPTSWLGQVKPLMTPAGYATAPQYGPLSSGGAYATAHQMNWKISTSVSSCVWAIQGNEPTGSSSAATSTTAPITQGQVTCTLDDTVVNSATGAPIATSTLPYGWAATGAQPPVVVSLIDQGGVWLIDADTSAIPS